MWHFSPRDCAFSLCVCLCGVLCACGLWSIYIFMIAFQLLFSCIYLASQCVSDSCLIAFFSLVCYDMCNKDTIATSSNF